MRTTWVKIDAGKNCFRFYIISLANDLFDTYVVCCEWGRIGSKRPRKKVEVFCSLDDANLRVNQLQKVRLQHHYIRT